MREGLTPCRSASHSRRGAAVPQDARGLDAVPLGEPLAEGAVAAAGAVAEDRPAVALERGTSAFGELLDGEALRRRDSAGERDHRRSVTAPPVVPSTTSPARPPSARPRSASYRPRSHGPRVPPSCPAPCPRSRR